MANGEKVGKGKRNKWDGTFVSLQARRGRPNKRRYGPQQDSEVARCRLVGGAQNRFQSAAADTEAGQRIQVAK